MASNPVYYIRVESEYAEQRLDNFLMRELSHVPKTHLYKLLRQGQVRVNGKRDKPGRRLQPGDSIRIPPLQGAVKRPVPLLDGGKALSASETVWARRLLDQVLYEDQGLLILNKPAGIAVHGGSGVGQGVIELLRRVHPASDRLELVHRLDRATSGCLVLSKKRSYLRFLHAALRDKKAEKRYLGLVRATGLPKEKAWCCTLPLHKYEVQSGERMVQVNLEKGQPSETHFERKRVYPKTGVALLQIQLVTGRTHQIRVHAASCGCPLAGDEKYGDASFNQALKAYGVNRLFLHAKSLVLPHPEGRLLHLEAPLQPELVRILERLEQLETLSHQKEQLEDGLGT